MKEGQKITNMQIIMTTVENQAQGQLIASALLQKKVAACVSLLPGVSSMYWWEGKITSGSEIILLIKTSAEKEGELRDELLALHPYTTPEIATLQVENINEDYMLWLNSSLAS